MKKLICLLLALVAMFALVSCGECDTCVDDDKDGLCDECGGPVALPGAEIFAMVKNAEPTQITTIDEVSMDGEAYNRVYNTTIYSDGSFKHVFEIERPASLDEESESAVVVESGVIEYANGKYTLNGEAVAAAPEVAYINAKNEITAANVTDFTIDSTGRVLTANLTTAACKAIFGIDVEAENITLTLTTNGTRLSQIVLSYTDANGVTVTSQTSYSYAPVTKA